MDADLFGECFWANTAGLEIFSGVLVLPCLAAITYCVLSAWGLRKCLPQVLDASPPAETVLKSAYGVLLDISDVRIDVDRAIERWVTQAAMAQILFALVLIAGAVVAVLRMNLGIPLTFFFDAVGSFLMFLCKVTFGVCAHHVHRRLSRLSRSVAGSWVLVLALSMDAMAFCTLLLVADCIWIELETSKVEPDFCFMTFLMQLSLSLSVVFQSLAAFSLFRIQERAIVFVSDQAVFSRVVGKHWLVLVAGTFGVGVGLWSVAALFAFASRHSLNPLEWMGAGYFLAASCQLLSGVAMLSINSAVRKHFLSPEGRKAVAAVAEMAGSVAAGEVIGMCSGG